MGCGLNFRPALGMQLKMWLVHKHLSHLGIQLKYPAYKKCVHLRKFTVRGSASGLIVATSKWQKTVMRARKEELGE